LKAHALTLRGFASRGREYSVPVLVSVGALAPQHTGPICTDIGA